MAILGRMMVKDVVRYRCVCKAWCSLIDSSHFINTHLEHSNHQGLGRLLLSCGRDFYWVNSINDTSFDVRRLWPLEGMDTTDRVYVLGSCNGLVAVANHKGDMALWNPSTTRYIRIPLPFTNSAHDRCRIDPIMIGFGYDPVNDDHKLLIVVFLEPSYSVTFEIQPHVRLFSLKAKTWKRIKYLPRCFLASRQGFGRGVLVENVLHWRADRFEQTSNSIWAIDLVTEDLNCLPIPDCIVKEKYSYIKLVELGGWLCLVCNYFNQDNADDADLNFVESVDIWVMKEYGVNESWTKLFSVTGAFDYLTPLAYLKASHHVLLNYGHDANKFVLYDMKEKRLENRNVSYQGFLTATFCVESLIGFDASYAQLDVWNDREKEKEKEKEKQQPCNAYR